MEKPRFVPSSQRAARAGERGWTIGATARDLNDGAGARKPTTLEQVLQLASGNRTSAPPRPTPLQPAPSPQPTEAPRPEKRKRRTGERRFQFDWDAADDTLGDPDTEVVPLRRRRADKLEAASESRDQTYWSAKPLSAMTERDWRIMREDFNISTKGGAVARPLRSWDEATGLPERLRAAVARAGYTEPTPIQRQAIPVQLARRDLIGIAETGSGKTASFVLPMLAWISQQPTGDDAAADGPHGLILAPTRELALQIETEALKFARPLGFSCVALVGGHTLEEQGFALRLGADIVVATPGRLRDALERRMLVLGRCRYVVLDEADRMVDMGFEADMRFILDQLPGAPRRQTVMFSATMPAAVERLSRTYLERPAVVTIGTAGQAVNRISQRVEFLADDAPKVRRLGELLRAGTFEPPIIVFVNQKRAADTVGRALERELRGVARVVALHGGKSQEQRETALAQLKSGARDVLVATDVAGRGLDIKGVSLVVNYDMAKSISDYTHRIGRTGRAGRAGTALSFVDLQRDSNILFDLKQMLLQSPVSRVPPQLAQHPDAQAKPGTFVAPRRRHEEKIFTNF